MQNIRDIKVNLHEIVIDERELENNLNLFTEQEFRVIPICKSSTNYRHQFIDVNTEKSNSVKK